LILNFINDNIINIKQCSNSSQNKLFYFVYVLFFIFISCESNDKIDSTLLYHISYDSKSDLSYFKIETEINNSEVTIKENALDIDAIKGATVWFKEKLYAPVQIEYKAVVVKEGGPNDRVSDLNCFFMAIDPICPSDISKCPDSLRTGKFRDYHRLRTYYVGYGGHDNTKTRMRRYPGYSGERPLLSQHDLGHPELIKPNDTIVVSIQIHKDNMSYSHDGRLIFEMKDNLPYTEGWFSFRTVRNHMRILDFKVSQITN
jgi:hypothetical protein